MWCWRASAASFSLAILASIIKHDYSSVALWSLLLAAAVLNERLDSMILRRRLAKRDLREVYPPARDQFHRDLERLERLRGGVAQHRSPRIWTEVHDEAVAKTRDTYYSDADVRPLLAAMQERQRRGGWRRRRTIAGPTYGEILAAFNAVATGVMRGLALMVPVVIGAVAVILILWWVSLL